jgi:tRNA-specific 2-thiouridylase
VSGTAVLLSGGVDSSVALIELQRRGAEDLTAYYIRIWLEDEMAFMGRCPWQDDLELVRAVCRLAGVRLEVLSLQREYFERVVATAVDELRAGRTPSPDVLCNQRVKFGVFVDRVGAEHERVATGHYASVTTDPGVATLHRGIDPVKDQTYFLCLLEQHQLRRCVFPLGGLRKREVRARARDAGLPNADRPDSQGICFLGRVPFDEFVRFHLGERPGPIREHGTGRRLGEHRGYWFYTIGQRRGLGLAGGPWYVVAKDVGDNVVLVAHGERLAEHRRRVLTVEPVHWIGAAPAGERLQVRLRHGPSLIDCTVRCGDGAAVEVTLDEGDTGIAPGQFAVFYDGDQCLGGGPIAE